MTNASVKVAAECLSDGLTRGLTRDNTVEMSAPSLLHLDLDGAWPRDAVPGVGYLDMREWNAPLRYCAPPALVEKFFAVARERLADFTLYGSGDFHYVTALLLRKIAEPFALVSFDNHPDWDIRPPHWCCGTWLNRALELPHLRHGMIWGCANGELNWPGRLFAKRAKHLRAHPWAERTSLSSQRIWPCVTRENWRKKFRELAARLPVKTFYVTVDLDCLISEESATNWESGLFTSADIAWALRELRAHGKIAGGDLCGAFSPVRYGRFFQMLAGRLDHPRGKKETDGAQAARINARALQTIWPALVAGNK